MEEYSRTPPYQMFRQNTELLCRLDILVNKIRELTYTRWKDAVETLAKFHRVVPASLNMQKFGKPSGFYNRQLRTFNTIQTAQAQAVSKKTGKPVGKIPHFDDMVQFFGDPKTQPKDRSTFVHGDYKIDNMVFHKTEPRVIGILEYACSHE